MPLQELPVNVPNRNGRPSSSSGQELDDQNVRDSIPPSSIQSMLRLTTETGELGEFSIKPPRVPRGGMKVSFTRSESHVSKDGLARPPRTLSPHPHRHHRPPDRRPSPTIIRQNVLGSDLISHQSHSRGTSQVSAQNLYDLEGMIHQLPQRNALPHHKSVGSLRQQQPRPRSPYAYPARLRRHGYRSPSPSIASDRPYGGYPPRGSSIRTASPPSVYLQRRLPPGYFSGFNQSATSLLKSPSSGPGPAHGIPDFNSSPLPSRANTPLSHMIPTPFASRAPTPIPSPSPHISLSSLNAATLRLGGSAPGSVASPSPSPLYYDYTEGFYDDGPHYRNNSSKLSLPLSSVGQTIPENVVDFKPENQQFGSSSRPAELPVPSFRRSPQESKGS
jgi:hypothetical protein